MYSEDAVKVDWVPTGVPEGQWGCPSDEDTGRRWRKFGNEPYWAAVKTQDGAGMQLGALSFGELRRARAQVLSTLGATVPTVSFQGFWRLEDASGVESESPYSGLQRRCHAIDPSLFLPMVPTRCSMQPYGTNSISLLALLLSPSLRKRKLT